MGDKFFRILRFFAPTVCAIRRKRGRVIRSLTRSPARSFIRSFTRGEENVGIYLRGQMRCSRVCESICIVLVSSLPVLSSSSNRRCPCFPTPSVFVAERFLARRFPAVRAPRRFYLIALLCFIEQLLRSRAVCFFLRSLPETAVSVISGFNAVALGLDSRMHRVRGTDRFLYSDRRKDLRRK